MARYDNRYSRFVAWVKIVLPLAALGLLSSLALFSRDIDPEAAIPFSDVDVKELAREQGIGAPTFTGVLSDGSPYRITAEAARPRAASLSQVDATRITGVVDRIDGTVVTLEAAEGGFDGGTGRLDLRGAVEVETSTDLTMTSERMTLFTEENRLISEVPVRVVAPFGTLDAGAMEIGPEAAGDAGTVLRFKNGVSLLYRPE
jgi:lipopolysaccharide export system protein LptC